MRRVLAWLSLALGQLADLMTTWASTSSGATEVSPLFHTPTVWLEAKLACVMIAAVVLAIRDWPPLARLALWLGLLGTATALWNWLQAGGW